jgi:tetratricopeptide (TPR) repeat protein
MLFRICIITVVVCVGGGIVPQFSFADSSNPARELLSAFRSYKSPVVRNEAETHSSSAVSQHRLARTYADQNDVAKANAHFGLALQNATPKQIPDIASDYAAFLLRTGDFRKAELILRQALTQSPQNEEFTRMLARCLVLQDKMTEGLRYLKSLGTEAEARAEIMAIYREQGNTDMLAAVEKKWRITESVRPEPTSSEPVLIATTPKPSVALPPVPTLVPKAATPPTLTISTTSNAMRTLPLASAVVAPKKSIVSEDVDMIVKAPVKQPLSRSEFFDNKVPIPVPVPKATPQPMVSITRLPKSVAATPVPKLPPAPEPTVAYSAAEKHALDELVLVNPVKFSTAPPPVPAPAQTEAKEPPRPAIASQPRRHYVTNASITTDMDALFMVKPTAATVLVK